MADTGQPTLHSLTLSDSVDVGTDPLLAITANVSDPDGIHTVQVHFSRQLLGSVDGAGSSAPVIWGYGDWNSGARTLHYQVNPINEPGTYQIDSVSIADGQYNLTILRTEQLRALGVDTTFTLSGTQPDRDAPVLKSLKMPATIDTSKGPALWKIEAQTSDALSGTSMLGIVLDRPIKQAGWSGSPFKPDISQYQDHNSVGIFVPGLDSGASKGYWIAAPNGVYGVSLVWLNDNSGNQVQLNQAALRALGVPTQIVVNDGSFVPPALSAELLTLPRTQNADGAIVLRLSSNEWSSSANTVEMTIEYDATKARFDGWRAGSEGAYALNAQTLEVGISGETRVSGTIDNKGDRSGFLDLHFKPSADSGNFAFDLNGITINGVTLLDSTDQSMAYRILTAVDGGAGADVLTGTRGDDYLRGLDGDDLFIESAGADTFAGGAGRDLARYASKRADYTVKREGADIVVASKYDATDIDRLQSVETIAFGDVRMEFDVNASAGHIFRLYQAAFDRLPDQDGLGFWVRAAEQGVSMQRIASDFAASQEFKALHAKDPSHAGIVDSFYRHALDRAPDLEGFKAWTGLLERGELDVGQVLLGFSESLENRQNTAELIGQGVSYTPL